MKYMHVMGCGVHECCGIWDTSIWWDMGKHGYGGIWETWIWWDMGNIDMMGYGKGGYGRIWST